MGAKAAVQTHRNDDTTAIAATSPRSAANTSRAALRALLIIVAAPFVAEPASSQGTNANACAPIQDDSVRLACYDAALRAAAAAQSAAPGATAPSTASAPPTATAAAPTPSAAPPVVPLEQAIAEPPQRQVRGASRDATAPTATAAAAIPPPAAAKHGLGTVVIVGMREGQGRALVFTTATGDEWIQTDVQRNRGYPDLPFDAEIKQGTMDSRFLVPSGGRAVRVRPRE